MMRVGIATTVVAMPYRPVPPKDDLPWDPPLAPDLEAQRQRGFEAAHEVLLFPAWEDWPMGLIHLVEMKRMSSPQAQNFPHPNHEEEL